MANQYIKGLSENTNPDGTDAIEIDDGTNSEWVKINNLFDGAPTQGDVIYFNGTKWKRLSAGTDGYVLTAGGAGTNPAWEAAASSAKGRGEILAATVPATLGAPLMSIADASSPVGGAPYFAFADAALAYRDFYCRLYDYHGGGLTLNFEVLRTSAAAAATYYFQAAIRRVNTATEDITASHTYDYNSVTVTIPAGPPAAGIPMAGTITFTNGADMDSLATNEMFVLRFRRDPTHANDNAGDTARVLATISIKET